MAETIPTGVELDIYDTAYNILAAWVRGNGGSHALFGVPDPGNWLEMIIAFLKEILPLLGCTAMAQRKTVTDQPLRARIALRISARKYNFSIREIPIVVDASMHLAQSATESQYFAFAAA